MISQRSQPMPDVASQLKVDRYGSRNSLCRCDTRENLCQSPTLTYQPAPGHRQCLTELSTLQLVSVHQHQREVEGRSTPPRLAGSRPWCPRHRSLHKPRSPVFIRGRKIFPTPGYMGRLPDLGPARLIPRSARSHMTSRCDSANSFRLVSSDWHPRLSPAVALRLKGWSHRVVIELRSNDRRCPLALDHETADRSFRARARAPLR